MDNYDKIIMQKLSRKPKRIMMLTCYKNNEIAKCDILERGFDPVSLTGDFDKVEIFERDDI